MYWHFLDYKQTSRKYLILSLKRIAHLIISIQNAQDLNFLVLGKI